jgi:hypothetical protein
MWERLVPREQPRAPDLREPVPPRVLVLVQVQVQAPPGPARRQPGPLRE